MKNNIKRIILKDFADFDVDVDICLGRMFSGLDYIQPNNRGKKK